MGLIKAAMASAVAIIWTARVIFLVVYEMLVGNPPAVPQGAFTAELFSF